MKRIELKPGETGVCLTGYGQWNHPLAMKAICEDGVIRTIRLNQQADTFFSWPGRTTIKKKSVTGWVSCDDGVYHFHANKKESEDERTH